jgi:hypothetical protein
MNVAVRLFAMEDLQDELTDDSTRTEVLCAWNEPQDTKGSLCQLTV